VGALVMLGKFPTPCLNGTIVVKLDKALYGCIESAKLWYDDLSSFLLEIGFKKSENDECIFHSIIEDHPVHISVFVDDFKITCREESIIKSIKSVENKVGWQDAQSIRRT
jgi:hypothetical protein